MIHHDLCLNHLPKALKVLAEGLCDTTDTKTGQCSSSVLSSAHSWGVWVLWVVRESAGSVCFACVEVHQCFMCAAHCCCRWPGQSVILALLLSVAVEVCSACHCCCTANTLLSNALCMQRSNRMLYRVPNPIQDAKYPDHCCCRSGFPFCCRPLWLGCRTWIISCLSAC